MYIFKFLMFAVFALAALPSFAANCNWQNRDTANFVCSGDSDSKAFQVDSDGFVLNQESAKFFDDFLGDAVGPAYDVSSGTDAEAIDPAIIAAAGGEMRLTSGDAGTGVDVDGSVFTQELNWAPAKGDMFYESRVAFDNSNTVAGFIGLTDAKASTIVELPATISGAAVGVSATDAVGFIYDTDATSDFVVAVAIKDGSVSGSKTTSILPVADTFNRYTIKVDSSGNVDWFVDGTQVYSDTAALNTTATFTMTPVFAIDARTTSSRSMDVDYLQIQQDR